MGKCKKIIFFLLIIIYPFYIYMKFKHLIELSQSSMCMIDCISVQIQRCLFIEILIWALLVIGCGKKYFRIMVIIRQKNIRYMMINILIKTFVTAVIISLYLLICTWLIGNIVSTDICNWQSYSSYGYYKMGVKSQSIIDIGKLLAAYFIIKISCFLITTDMIMITWLWFNTPLIGYVIVAVTYIIENSFSPPVVKLFFAYANLDFTALYFKGIDSFHMMIFPIICAVVITIILLILSKKRDWLIN